MAQADSQPSIERLQDLIQKHRVCYEVWPAYLMVEGKRVQVGFELELCGTHEHEGDQFEPGCPQCHQTFDDLQQIAEWVKPKKARASRYEIQPFDRALRETPKRGFRPEVVLSMKILHRHGFDQPVDECEEFCLKEMQTKLRELGVPEGSWHSHQS